MSSSGTARIIGPSSAATRCSPTKNEDSPTCAEALLRRDPLVPVDAVLGEVDVLHGPLLALPQEVELAVAQEVRLAAVGGLVQGGIAGRAEVDALGARRGGSVTTGSFDARAPSVLQRLAGRRVSHPDREQRVEVVLGEDLEGDHRLGALDAVERRAAGDDVGELLVLAHADDRHEVPLARDRVGLGDAVDVGERRRRAWTSRSRSASIRTIGVGHGVWRLPRLRARRPRSRRGLDVGLERLRVGLDRRERVVVAGDDRARRRRAPRPSRRRAVHRVVAADAHQRDVDRGRGASTSARSENSAVSPRW